MAETAVVLGAALVAYLSVNAVTHPQTLRIQLTHLWPWPSEGTVRVIGLGICLAAVAISHYLRVTAATRVDQARRLLGWQVHYDITEGIRHLLQWAAIRDEVLSADLTLQSPDGRA